MRRRRKKEEQTSHERWLVSYADFITLLFAFFTTLYAISTVDQQKAGRLQYAMMTAFNVALFTSDRPVDAGAPNPTVTDPIRVLEGALEGLGRGELEGKFTMRRSGEELVISLPEANFFASGRDEVRGEALRVLDRLARELKIDGVELAVEGHTDDVPLKDGRRTNWDLSVARATSVVRYLLERHEFDPARLSAAGYAEYRPVADNSTADGRAKNRRVDIVVKPRIVSPDGNL